MKKTLLILSLAVVSAVASAQAPRGTWSIRPEAGITYSSVLASTTFLRDGKSQFKLGFVAGAEAEYMIGDAFSISAGALYTREGSRFDKGSITVLDYTSNLNYELIIDYLNVPIMGHYYFSKGLAFNFGVQPGYVINATYENRTEYADSMIKKFDVAGMVGLSYEINHLVFDLRYQIGALDICKNPNLETTFNNNYFSFTVGYRIGR